MKIECEAKFFNIDIERLQKQLANLGALRIKGKQLLRRKIFDFPHNNEQKQWIRVRDEGDKITITLKKVLNDTIADGTYELEFGVDNFERACDFLVACGFIPRAYQENYRESWAYQGELITIDTWPGLAPFVEIEARDETMLRSIVKALDFDFQQAYFGTIDKLYERVYGIPAARFNQIKELTFDTVDNIINSLRLK
jgi:adenylate cyclase class 2